jgi:hypothetical protein
MALRNIISKSGAPIITIPDWVAGKEDPAMSALLALHEERITSGNEFVALENLAMDEFYNQYLAETNQELV